MEKIKEGMAFVRDRLAGVNKKGFRNVKPITKLTGNKLKDELVLFYLVGMLSGKEQVLRAIERPEESSIGELQSLDDVIAELHIQLDEMVRSINKMPGANLDISFEDIIHRYSKAGVQ